MKHTWFKVYVCLALALALLLGLGILFGLFVVHQDLRSIREIESAQLSAMKPTSTPAADTSAREAGEEATLEPPEAITETVSLLRRVVEGDTILYQNLCISTDDVGDTSIAPGTVVTVTGAYDGNCLAVKYEVNDGNGNWSRPTGFIIGGRTVPVGKSIKFEPNQLAYISPFGASYTNSYENEADAPIILPGAPTVINGRGAGTEILVNLVGKHQPDGKDYTDAVGVSASRLMTVNLGDTVYIWRGTSYEGGSPFSEGTAVKILQIDEDGHRLRVAPENNPDSEWTWVPFENTGLIKHLQ